MKNIGVGRGLFFVTVCAWLGLACSSSSSGDGAQSDCNTSCAKADALHCTKDQPGQTCQSACQLAQQGVAAVPACKAAYDALASCSTNATYTCGTDGHAAPVGCDAQESAFFQCILGNVDAGAG
jgi:hypothetical protein